jgi:hypothetical protein
MGYEKGVRLGTLRTLLQSSQGGGKILNALNFPMPEKGMGSFSFSTDSAAWSVTKGAAGCTVEKAPPLGDFRWGLAGTTGAVSWWHVDSNGFGTYVDTKAGLKWWMVAKRKGSRDNSESLGDVMEFFKEIYEVDGQKLDNWELEAVMLPPRTRL